MNLDQFAKRMRETADEVEKGKPYHEKGGR